MRLSLLFCGVLAACSAPQTLRESSQDHLSNIDAAIRKNVHDTDRANAMLELQSKIQERTMRMYDDLTKVQTEFVVLNRNYDSTRAQFQALRNRMATARSSATQEMIRIAMEARSVATAEDWAGIAKDMGAEDTDAEDTDAEDTGK